jgi:hypothetical protein
MTGWRVSSISGLYVLNLGTFSVGSGWSDGEVERESVTGCNTMVTSCGYVGSAAAVSYTPRGLDPVGCLRNQFGKSAGA